MTFGSIELSNDLFVGWKILSDHKMQHIWKSKSKLKYWWTSSSKHCII